MRETDPEQTYFCHLLRSPDIAAKQRPSSRETVSARHHDRALYILAKGKAGEAIRRAPFINHTDQELALDRIAGRRTPPCRVPGTPTMRRARLP